MINQPKIPLKQLILSKYHKFLERFEKKKAEQFPESNLYNYPINLVDTFRLCNFKTYQLSPKKRLELDQFLKKNLWKEYIWLFQSPMASPFFFIRKKDRTLCLCQNYWYLNEHTIKNIYPLPLIAELINKLAKAYIFTKLDL